VTFTLDRKVWQPYLWDVYHRLHQIPEISGQEFKTSSFLKEQLILLGFSTITVPDLTGVIGIRGKGPRTSALRADMDALCHSTDTGECVLHSCGHDAHMSMVLTAAGVLSQLPLSDEVTVKIIFQPAEETGEGALSLIKSGIVDDLDYLFGVHLRPKEELAGGMFCPAINHGASQTIHGEVKGVSAHGARPHLGINVIEVIMNFSQMLQSMHLDPLVPSSIKMTRISAGSSDNVIPEQGEFTLDVRAQSNTQMKKIVELVQKAAAAAEIALGGKISLTLRGKSPAAEVNIQAEELMSRAIVDTTGPQSLTAPLITSGAEDFHYYTSEIPGIKASMLGVGCNLQPGLHHPDMEFDISYLMDGAEILSRALWYSIKQEKGVERNG